LSTFCGKKIENHEYLNQLMPFLFAYYTFHKAIADNTPITDKTVIQLFNQGEPASDKASKTFSKLVEFIDEITTNIQLFTPNYLRDFVTSLKCTNDNLLEICRNYKDDQNVTYIDLLSGEILTGYVLTLMGKLEDNQDNVKDSFVELLKGRKDYRSAVSEEKKANKARSQSTTVTPNLNTNWIAAKTRLDAIDMEIVEYSKTFSSNPRGSDNCNKRYDLIINY
jgi:hypothetical protein